jgi:hypothetical protein
MADLSENSSEDVAPKRFIKKNSMAVNKGNSNKIHHSKYTSKSRGTTKKYQPRSHNKYMADSSESLSEDVAPKRYIKKNSKASVEKNICKYNKYEVDYDSCSESEQEPRYLSPYRADHQYYEKNQNDGDRKKNVKHALNYDSPRLPKKKIFIETPAEEQTKELTHRTVTTKIIQSRQMEVVHAYKGKIIDPYDPINLPFFDYRNDINDVDDDVDRPNNSNMKDGKEILDNYQ